jgi:chorismate dehydratase
MIKVSVVSYLNSKPFIYGLEHSGILIKIELSLDMPSHCADKLLDGSVDIGLVPVAILPKMKEYHILTDYCIGAIGAVRSVMLYSDVPLNKIRKVYLDYQSRTSVMLTRVLAHYFWSIKPQWLNTEEGYEDLVADDTAAVVIGDRALLLENKYKYAYDLAEEWEKFSGMPFVFACWVANKQLPEAFLADFNAAISLGIDNKEAAINEWITKTNSDIDVREYLEKNISYELDKRKRQALDLFLRFAVELDANIPLSYRATASKI